MPVTRPVIGSLSRTFLNSNLKLLGRVNHPRCSTPVSFRLSTSASLPISNADSTVERKLRGNLIRANEKLEDRLDDPDEDFEAIERSLCESREFQDIRVEDFRDIYGDDQTGTKKSQIEVILGEYEYLKYNTLGRVVSEISLSDMQQLLNEGTTPALRERIFNYLFKREMARRSNMRRKSRERAFKDKMREERTKEMVEKYGIQRTGLLSSNNELIYGLWHNSLFCRITETKLKSGNSMSRLKNAALFGKKLVFDFGYEDYMGPQATRSCMEQVQEAYGINRYDYLEPFDIWFCNFSKSSRSAEFLTSSCLRNLYDSSMVTVKEDCFMNHFDPSRLVYLSPNARESLTGDISRNDDVYIIGVYNDKGRSLPLSFRRAGSLNIRCRSLPLDAHISWQGSSKSLCVNHVAGILLEVMANGGDWRGAFLKHIPDRKIKPVEVVLEEERQRRERLKAKRSRDFSLRLDLD